MKQNVETFIGCDADYAAARIVLFGPGNYSVHRLIPPPVSAPVRASAQPRSATKASDWKRTARIRIKIWKISPYLTAAI